MFQNSWLVFSDAQTSTSSTTDASTNVIDTEVAASNLGGGTPVWLVTRVNTAFSGSSGTFWAVLQDGASSGSFTTLIIGPTVTTVILAKGFDLLTIPLPVEHRRYLRMLYQQASGSGYTGGKIDSFLTLAAPLN